MKPLARVDDHTTCPKDDHAGGPLVSASKAKVCLTAGGKPVARLGDFATCKPPAPRDVVFEGAATFTVCGLPVAREEDGMAHGGAIREGDPHVLVGGPKFKLPKNLVIGGGAEFQNEVIRDLYRLSTTRTGKAILDGIDKSGKTVTILPRDQDPLPLPTGVPPDEDFFNRQNSRADAVDPAKATNGAGSDSKLYYVPSSAMNVEGENGTSIPAPPQVSLGHELIHAMHNANGANITPKGTGTAPTLSPEEVETAGLPPYQNGFPSENSLRDDLKLPRRGGYGADSDDDNGGLLKGPKVNLRPGDCKP